MTEQEKIEQQNYQLDSIKRKEIINQSILIALKDLSQDEIKMLLKNSKTLQQYYNTHYNNYLNQGLVCDITTDVYSYGDFWFNDAGFQFRWKNHKHLLMLECLNWNEVKKLLNEYIQN